MLKPGTRTILVADLRGLNPEDFAPISASPHNPVVIAIRDSASAGMVDALMLEGAIQALVDSPVEAAPMLRAINDAARISSTADALSAVTAPSSGSSGGEEKSGKSPVMLIGIVVGGAGRCGRRLVLHVQGFFRPDAGCRRYVARRLRARPAWRIVDGCRPRRPRRSMKCSKRRASRWTSAATSSPPRTMRSNISARCCMLEPGNAEATEGLKRLGGLLIARARTALDERRFDNALAELEAARSIDPNDPRLVEVDARLDSMRAQTALAQIQATLAAQNFDRAQTLLEAAQKDALLPPAQIAQLSKDLDSKRRVRRSSAAWWRTPSRAFQWPPRDSE